MTIRDAYQSHEICNFGEPPITGLPVLERQPPPAGRLSMLEEAAEFLKSFPDCAFLLWGEDHGYEVIEYSSDLSVCVALLQLVSGNEEVVGGRLSTHCTLPDLESIKAAAGTVCAYLTQFRARKFFRYAIWFHFPMRTKAFSYSSSKQAEKKGLVALAEVVSDQVCELPATKGIRAPSVWTRWEEDND
jgi:hypothetical protein